MTTSGLWKEPIFIRCIYILNITSEVELYLLLNSEFSLEENEEKVNTIQPPPFLCFSHIQLVSRALVCCLNT